MAASEIKAKLLKSVRKYPQQNLEPCRNQLINLLCKLTDWFPHNTSLYQRYLQANFNAIFQSVIKKNRKSSVKPESYSEPHQNERQRSFLKNSQPLKSVCKKLHP